MTQQLLSQTAPLSPPKGQSYLLLLQGLGYLLPLTLFSGGAVMAQSSSSVEPLPSLNQAQSASPLEPIQASETAPQKPALPDYESVSPLRVNEPKAETSTASKPEPKSESQPQQKLKPIQPLVNSPSQSTPEAVPKTSPSQPASPEVAESSPPSQPTVNLEQRQVNSPNHSPQEESKVPVWQKTETSTTTETQDYVDFNGYPSTGENSLPTPRVEVSDRAENCTTVVENGKLVSGSCNVSQEQTDSQQAAVDVEKLPALPKNFQQPSPQEQNEVRTTYTPPEDLPELKLPGNGDSALMFPLAQAMPVSSNYGWRIHPIHGNRRFHTGTDFTAPEGTPVVATKSGRVVLADYTSGYGLIVGLRHNDKNESRYAHLSQIHVKPGQWVEQGTIIGRVGSTGLSTGPHLHFEWRVRKGSRWIAVNAGKQLLMAKANLDPSQINFSNLANYGMNRSNFLASLPEVLTTLPAATASWMSLPELPFLKGNFQQAYERKADLAHFSQRSKSVVVLPFSLPKVLASLFNWEPPELFAQENLQRVPTGNQINF
ncbi:MAG: peptidoglycan DD-metalloendopeptidase family protein, partial [Halothece sp. Uz-M2-17]|nr:peptidoglycan DD-metalloendopeptidase family protein [Halothece sp. Uz-M2-17]